MNMRTILIIGAHYFGKDTNDKSYGFLSRTIWNATHLFEANPNVFETLKKIILPHSFGKVTFTNAGLCPEHEENKSFYMLKNPKRAWWGSQIGSFNKSHLVKHFKHLENSDILVKYVVCYSISSIVEEYSPTYLSIDTEGFDCKLVNSITCYNLRTTKELIFEHMHCNVYEFKETLIHISKCGFVAYFDKENVYFKKNSKALEHKY